ncbi:MAG: PadR family transcriptional regulator [Candidatus Thermoplasmatota archaeon]|nr:PadR family transcriptional regulator [Candidatus Thermoplasmatota archaeon]
MRTPFLKYFMLKTISEGKANGYKIIKKCEEILGYRPSTGSVYPLLKGMEKKNVIKGEKKGRGTVYSITAKGKKLLDEGEKLREEIYQKLSSHVSSVAEIFEDNGLKNLLKEARAGRFSCRSLMISKIWDVATELERNGVDSKKIRSILAKAYQQLVDLKEEKNDRNK